MIDGREMPLQHTPPGRREVVLTDMDIPMGRLVVIILKILVASIPAILLFYGVVAVIMLLVAGIASAF